jgi:hypothetical protein
MLSPRNQACGYCGINLRCELVSGRVDCEDQLSYTTYGLCVKDSEGEIVLRYQDISTDKKTVEDFIDMCASCGASAVHIGDILEDYIK